MDLFQKVSRKRLIIYFIGGSLLLALIACVMMLHGKMFVIVENAPLSMENYRRVFSSIFMWNDYLNSPSSDQGIFNFRGYLYLIGKITSLELGQLIFLAKIALLAAAHIGLVLNARFLNKKYFENKIPTAAIHIGALVYVFNPSFLVGDNFWLGIQVGYYTLPLILYAAIQVFIGRRIALQAIFLFWLFSINNIAHFSFGGYQFFIIAYIFLIMLLDKELLAQKVALLGRCCLIAACFILGEASLLVGTYTAISSVPTSMTKESIDVPWTTATFSNITHGMSYTQIFKDFYSSSNQILNAFIGALLLIVPGAIIWLLTIFNSPRNLVLGRKLRKAVLVGMGAYLVVLFIFATDSPTHFMRYIVTLDFPLGRVFRTWRVPETAIAVISAGLFTVAIAVGMHFKPSRSKNFRIGVGFMALMGVAVLAYPVFQNKLNGPIISIPKDYQALNKYLGEVNDQTHSVLFSPAFIASYGVGATLRPYWSPYIGMIMEFIEYSPPMRSIVPQNSPKNFYLYTSSEFYAKNGLLINSSFYALSRFYALNDISYLVLHTDMPTALSEREIPKAISQSEYWQSLKSFGKLFLFKNKVKSNDVRVAENKNVIMVNGGYRVVTRLFNELPQSASSNTEFLFIDQAVKFEQLKKVTTLLSDKDQSQNVYDYMYSDALGSKAANINLPALGTEEYAPEKNWSTATLASSHQQEWQPYINEMSDYAWDFDEQAGYLMTSHDTSQIKLKLKQKSIGPKVALVRYLANDGGGSISFKFGSDKFDINTMSNYNGMLWAELQINGNIDSYELTNKQGFNAVSSVMVLDRAEYDRLKSESVAALSDVKVIDAHIPYDKNLIPGGPLENPAQAALWQPTKGANGFTWKFENSPNTDKHPAMVIAKNNSDQEWSWIGSPWMTVEPNRSYEFITNMKTINTTSSHIIFLGQNSKTGREEQIAQVPYGISGTNDWQRYQHEFILSGNYSRVRVLLNAGWAQDVTAGPAVTMFSGIQLVPLEEARNDFNLEKTNNVLISSKKVNPTLREVNIRPTDEPVFISTTDSFDDGWRAFIAPSNNKQTFWQWLSMKRPGTELPADSHLRANGFNNGWQISPADYKNIAGENGYKVVLEYWPQHYFAVGLMLTGTGLAISVIFLVPIALKARKPKTLRQNNK